jgi:hypothetical protein
LERTVQIANPLHSDSAQPRRATNEPPLGDLRFRSLLSDNEWQSLPPSIRQRFSKRVTDKRTVVYVGQVLEASFSKMGWLLAQAARLIGGPFPVSADVGVASVVSVTEDYASGGQIWTRLYARRSGFPHIVHSSKRFAGPTGLEEHVGIGVGMTLRIAVENGALTFRSDRYFIDVTGFRIYLPAWLCPGALTVTHCESGDGRFAFLLEVLHPRFGLLLRQLAVFRETRHDL